MNSRLLDLAKRAGFVLWEDEDHKPKDAFIDWASDYDEEVKTLVELVVRECALFQLQRSMQRHGYDKYDDAQAMLDNFEVKWTKDEHQ